MYVIGLMSGTSADGVDAALVDIRGTGHDLKITLKAFRTFPYPTAFRERLLQVMTGGTVEDVCHLNGALGEWFARAALKVLKAAGVSPRRVALIGSHGRRFITCRSRGANRSSGRSGPPCNWARRPSSPSGPASPRWPTFAAGTWRSVGT